MNAMRAFLQDYQSWLSAFLFQFKIYTVIAILPLIIWYENLPQYQESAIGVVDYSWYYRLSEFCLVGNYVGEGYLVTAFILSAGGLAQFFIISRKTAIWSIVFSIAALVIGNSLRNYCQTHIGVYIE